MKRIILLFLIFFITLNSCEGPDNIKDSAGELRINSSAISPEEIDKLFSIGRSEFFIITEVPKESEGEFLLNGEPIILNQGISRENLEKIEMKLNENVKSMVLKFKCWGKEAEIIYISSGEIKYKINN